MASSSFDCYLCGTTNPPDADHCVSCSGQLLKLPADDLELEDADESKDSDEANQSDELSHMADFEDLIMPLPQPEAAPEPELKPAPEPKPERNPIQRRLRRSVHTSVEDLRLSDALGLSGEADDGLDQLDVEVTSIPRAKAAENIPVIGTRELRGERHIPTDDEEIGKIAYVITALLIVATVWFGYNSLFRDRSPGPENIAFVDTTTTMAPTTSTTVAPDLNMSRENVDFTFGPTILRVVAFDCDTSGQALEDTLVGVAIDERSVVLANSLPEGTDIVRLVSRTGSTRIAAVSNQGGINVATARVLTSRHLGLDDMDLDGPADPATFFVGYDAESNVVSTTDTPQNLDAGIAISDYGVVRNVQIAGSTFSAEELAAIDVSIEINPDLAIRGNGACAAGATFVPMASGIGGAEASENETDADLEETDAG